MTTAESLKVFLLSTTLILGACAKSPEPGDEPAAPAASKSTAAKPKPAAAPPPPPPSGKFGAEIPQEAIATTFGRGKYEAADGQAISFKIDASYLPDGSAVGAVEFSQFDDNGKKMDFIADIVCGHFDEDKLRGWVGAKIDANRSTKDDYKGGRYATGKSVWLRFEESDSNDVMAAKLSLPRFTGDDKFASAEDFCKARTWPAGDAGLFTITPPDSALMTIPIPKS